jgi:DNA-binding MarR family transcriptional regulator
MPRPSKQVRQLVNELGIAMQAYQRSTQAYDDAVGRALGLNPADLRCLDWLFDGPKSAGQLSTATGLKAAATTALIDRLTEKGFVRRVPSSDDRRKVLVEMTDEGMGRTFAMYQPLVEEGQRSLVRLSVEELTYMRDYLVEIRELTDRHRERLQRHETGVPS